MVDKILTITKITFGIHFVIGFIFTILFFIPDIIIPIFGLALTLDTHALSLTIGCLFAGFTASSLFGVFAKEWKQVKIVVISELVWLAGNLITGIISFSVFNLLNAIFTLILTIVLLLLFALVLLKQEDIF